MSTQMAVIRATSVKAELVALAKDADDEERRQQEAYALAKDADDEERRQQEAYEEYQRELLKWEYELDEFDADDNETYEAWERTRACALVWDYHPNLDENSACKMYAEFEAFSAAGHSYVDALAFSGMCPSNNPSVNYVRRFDPHCSEEDAIERYRVYRSYRDEGQSEIVSRQYAGLL